MARPVLGRHDRQLSRPARSRSDRPDAQRQRLIIGPWAHGATSGVFPERSFGVQARVRRGRHHRRPTGAGSRSTWRARPCDAVQPGADLRHGTRCLARRAGLAPAGHRVRRLLPRQRGDARTSSGDGTLSTSTGSAAASDSFVYDPADPVTTCGGATFLPGLFIGANAGPRDQTRTEARQDVLCYTSDAARPARWR